MRAWVSPGKGARSFSSSFTMFWRFIESRTIRLFTFNGTPFITIIWNSGCQEMIADSRAELECARLLTLSCASAIDNLGPNKARDQIAMIKYSVPELAFRIIDRAVQVSFPSMQNECYVYLEYSPLNAFHHCDFYLKGAWGSRGLPGFSSRSRPRRYENTQNSRWTRCSS